MKLIISLASSAEVKILGAVPAVPKYLHDAVLNEAAFDSVEMYSSCGHAVPKADFFFTFHWTSNVRQSLVCKNYLSHSSVVYLIQH